MVGMVVISGTWLFSPGNVDVFMLGMEHVCLHRRCRTGKHHTRRLCCLSSSQEIGV